MVDKIQRFTVVALALSTTASVLAQPKVRKDLPEKAVAKNKERFVALAQRIKPAVATVTVEGRGGRREGVGTAFVVRADGLLATNLHVIGEARPVSVRFADGKKFDVVSVFATDRASDLALLKIAATGLPALEIGDYESLSEGQEVLAIGNPHGLMHSIVAGVVSGKRNIEGRPMVQLAMPIEPGNSGGPIVDMDGKVRGIVSMKSMVAENLGFAVSSDLLAPLLQKPNPVPMDRWVTIGALDPREWHVVFGGRWRQRAGRIQSDGLGESFGGRTLCLSQRPSDKSAKEIAVTVKLESESGAAGLVFSSDGGDRHYGFYPSSGKVRLTRFDGPDVTSWRILHDAPAKAYRPGEWNQLRLRIDAERVIGYVNNEMVVEAPISDLAGNRVGLAKFRDTKAEFKDFRVGAKLDLAARSKPPANEIVATIEGVLSNALANEAAVSKLAANADSVSLMRQRAKDLERQAALLREVSQAVHGTVVRRQLVASLEGPDEKANLLRAALLVAKLDNEDLDVDAYIGEVDRMADAVRRRLDPKADDATRFAMLKTYLFDELGFHGSRSDYGNRSNSRLNEVIDDREGLPIALSVLTIELACRLNLQAEGVGLPGHFVVRFKPVNAKAKLVDPFDRGNELSEGDLTRQVLLTLGRDPRTTDFAAVPKRTIIARMLRNMVQSAGDGADATGVLRYLDALVAIDPDSANDRWQRAVASFRIGRREEALRDIDWLTEKEPPGLDLEQLQQLRQALERTGQ